MSQKKSNKSKAKHPHTHAKQSTPPHAKNTPTHTHAKDAPPHTHLSSCNLAFSCHDSVS